MSLKRPKVLGFLGFPFQRLNAFVAFIEEKYYKIRLQKPFIFCYFKVGECQKKLNRKKEIMKGQKGNFNILTFVISLIIYCVTHQ